MLRSLIALLVVSSYLWLGGIGYISRPEESPYLVKIETSYGAKRHYEECRYMRMDGLEAFMNEAMAARYQNDAGDNHTKHHISVTTGIDSHVFPGFLQINLAVFFRKSVDLPSDEQNLLAGFLFNAFSPPRQVIAV